MKYETLDAKYVNTNIIPQLNIGKYMHVLLLKAEIDGRQETFRVLKENGHTLGSDVGPSLAKLEELRRTLIAAWDDRRQRLSQALELQQFRAQAEQADNWLAAKEAFLNNDDLGVGSATF